ncbi:MAG: IS110 family transposase [Tannerella sp.]|jgi:transposase|nr:IS110 family transposase [Tannerella sp.]
MSVFETGGKITGRAGLRPGNDESAGKYINTATAKGNNYLRSALVQVAWAASRMKSGCSYSVSTVRLSFPFFLAAQYR